MGKYMRSKCRGGAAGEEVAAVEVTQVVGVRTRSRSAAATTGGGGGGGVAKVVAPRRKKALMTPPAGEPAAAAVGAGGGDGGGSCYIHLRSRMLFMAPPQQQPAAEAGAGQPQAGAAALVAGLSRCSSTASSVDVGGQRGSLHAACRSDAAAEVVGGGYHVPDVSASNSGSGPADRERRETTPSSRAHGGELSDLESDLAGQKTGRPLPAAAATAAAELIVPPAHEIQEFFAAAEAAQAKRFASKYNFDFVRGVPHDAGGRFEWTPVVSI